jgi:pyruvyltransferase
MPIYLKQFTEDPNVGDVMSARIVAGVTGCNVRVIGEAPFAQTNLIAIGSIAQWADAHSMLWGCGLLEDAARPPAAPARVLAVRGRLTLERLASAGIPCDEVFGDPALLAPEFFGASPRLHPLGLVPHYVDRGSPFVEECRRAGIPILDVFSSPETFVAALTSCERIISSSLHGIVLAHAYGIEAAWVRISDGVLGNGFKFFDYYSSLGVPRSDVIACIPGVDSLEDMAERCALPGRLPDLAKLRGALLAALPQLDIAPAEAAA